MDKITKSCKGTVKTRVCTHKLQPVLISELIYADDLAIVTNTERHMQLNLEAWYANFKRIGMKINNEKTEFLVITKSQDGCFDAMFILTSDREIDENPNFTSRMMTLPIERRQVDCIDLNIYYNTTQLDTIR